jgi:hypothetical protein
LALLLGAANAPAQLASDRIRILGVSLEVSPPSLTAPRNVPILLNTALVDGDGADVSARADVSGARVLARLSGPGVDGVQTLEAAPGERLEIAPLLVAGNYVVEDVRLVDGGGATILAASPDVVPIKIIDGVIVSEVLASALPRRDPLARHSRRRGRLHRLTDGDPSLPFGSVRVPTIAAGDAETVRFELIARRNGRVTAAAFEGTPGVAGAFVLRTGVGDAGIPLSPDTLVLPSYVYDLPHGFLAEAERVLGLAHSVATAPAGQDVGIARRTGRSVVERRALQLAESGLRVRIGEETRTSLLELWLDWAGNGCPEGAAACQGFDPGFDEILRVTDAGHDLESALAEEIVAGCQAPGGACASILDAHDLLGAAESYRGAFASVLATGDAHVAVSDAAGAVTRGCAGTNAALAGGRCPVAAIERGVEATSLLGFDDGAGFTGEWLFSGRDPAAATNDPSCAISRRRRAGSCRAPCATATATRSPTFPWS